MSLLTGRNIGIGLLASFACFAYSIHGRDPCLDELTVLQLFFASIFFTFIGLSAMYLIFFGE